MLISDDYQLIELITGTARRWATEQKLRIEASYDPGESVSSVKCQRKNFAEEKWYVLTQAATVVGESRKRKADAPSMQMTRRNPTMTENIEALGAWLANAGVDPDATTIPMPTHVPLQHWWRVKNHARAMLLERLPERQRQLLVLLYAEVCAEIVASALEEAENKRR